jgi:hypothetical protein
MVIGGHVTAVAGRIANPHPAFSADTTHEISLIYLLNKCSIYSNLKAVNLLQAF